MRQKFIDQCFLYVWVHGITNEVKTHRKQNTQRNPSTCSRAPMFDSILDSIYAAWMHSDEHKSRDKGATNAHQQIREHALTLLSRITRLQFPMIDELLTLLHTTRLDSTRTVHITKHHYTRPAYVYSTQTMSLSAPSSAVCISINSLRCL